MNNDFKRMQELAGINTEDNNWKELLNEWFEGYINSGNPIYDGLEEVLNSKELLSLMDGHYEDQIENGSSSEDAYENTNAYISTIVLKRFNKQLYQNLINNGYEYNRESDTWTTPEGESMDSFELIESIWPDTSYDGNGDNFPDEFTPYQFIDENKNINMNNEFKRMQELAGININEETDHTQFPPTFNHHDEEFILGAITPDMLFYLNPEEGDDNANVVALSHEMEILSDNIHASNAFLEAVQEKQYTWLTPELEQWAFETQEEFNMEMK